MAEHSFQEVMRQYYRMCNGHLCTSLCPLKDDKTAFCKTMGRMVTDKGAEKVEEIIMQWAAEHPEPVYPRWVDWLADVGLIINSTDHYAFNFTRAIDPIPADIAEKLGIEPKEGD